MGHAVQWVICMLHTNELPLRHYFVLKDGPTTGPSSFNGEIGQLITKQEFLQEMPIVNFSPIPNIPLPNLDVYSLSKDQQYLYLMVNAVMQGYMPEALAARKPGRVHHARFMNLGTNCLRLYVSEEEPSEQLKSICEFVVKVCLCFNNFFQTYLFQIHLSFYRILPHFI